ncbi:MAG TPA: hypothetical protein VF420_13255 [Casimicrobiaceae bacterium]
MPPSTRGPIELDAVEAEKLWEHLAQLSAQIGDVHAIATDTVIRLDKFERNLLHQSEQAGRRGAKRGARNQAAIVAAVITVLGAVANYFSARAAAMSATHAQAGGTVVHVQ